MALSSTDLAFSLFKAPRWHVSVPLGLVHFTSEDDEYNGYHIPKDSVVMVNVWCVTLVTCSPI